LALAEDNERRVRFAMLSTLDSSMLLFGDRWIRGGGAREDDEGADEEADGEGADSSDRGVCEREDGSGISAGERDEAGVGVDLDGGLGS